MYCSLDVNLSKALSFFNEFTVINYISGANICNLRDTSSTSGDVSSPGYPRNYPANQRCSFAIRVPSGNSIVVTFKEIDLEHEKGILLLFTHCFVHDVV